MDLFTLMAKIGIDDTSYNKGIDSATKKGKSFASNLGTHITSGVKTLAKGVTTAAGLASAGIVALGKIGLDYNTEMESVTTDFKVMLGNQEKAVQKVNELKEMAAKTPFALNDLAQGTKTLLAFNVASEDSTSILKMLGDISLGNSEKLETLTRAYGKMNASQKVSLEDINMMIDSGFNPLLLVCEKTGESMTEVYDRISKGTISVDEITEAFKTATSAGGQFYNGMEEASKTTAGMISTLKDNVNALVGEVFEPISKGLLEQILPTAIESIDALTTAYKERGVDGLIQAGGEMMGGFIGTLVQKAPSMVQSGFKLVKSFLDGLQQQIPAVSSGAIQIVTQLILSTVEMLPQVIQMGVTLLISLCDGLSESTPELIPVMITALFTMVDTLLNNIDSLVDAGIELLMALSDGLIDALPGLIEKIPIIIDKLIMAITNNTPKMMSAGIQLILKLAVGLIKAIPDLLKAIPQIIASIVKGFGNLAGNMVNVGKDLVKKVWDGITSMGKWISDKVSRFFKGLFSKDKTKVAVEAEYTESSSTSKTRKHAAGGIMTKPTLFAYSNKVKHIGGESGAEAIIPLKKLPELMKKMGYIKPENIVTHMSIDGREFAVSIVPYVNEELSFA